MFVNEIMYNGFKAGDVKSTGATKNSIMAAKDGICGRGVLLDIPRLKGVDWLDLGERVSPDDLEAAEQAQCVQVGEGDILVIATGRDARRAALGAWAPMDGLAGLDARAVSWLHDRRIAVLGSDGVSDAIPNTDTRLANAHPPMRHRGDRPAPARQPSLGRVGHRLCRATALGVLPFHRAKSASSAAPGRR